MKWQVSFHAWGGAQQFAEPQFGPRPVGIMSLPDGWEPFAMTTDPDGHETIWLRRPEPDERNERDIFRPAFRSPTEAAG